MSGLPHGAGDALESLLVLHLKLSHLSTLQSEALEEYIRSEVGN